MSESFGHAVFCSLCGLQLVRVGNGLACICCGEVALSPTGWSRDRWCPHGPGVPQRVLKDLGRAAVVAARAGFA